jgi:hypothetical protein
MSVFIGTRGNFACVCFYVIIWYYHMIKSRKPIKSPKIPNPVAVDKKATPLLPPPKIANPSWRTAPYVKQAILARLPQLVASAKKEIIYSDPKAPAFIPPAHCIIDYDFVLYVFADHWLTLASTNGKAHAYKDIRTELPPLLRANLARRCLMSLHGAAWTPRDGWPDDTDETHARWTASRCRQLHAAGLISMPEAFDDNGIRSYAARLTEAGLIRAIWIHLRLPKKITKTASVSLSHLITVNNKKIPNT